MRVELNISRANHSATGATKCAQVGAVCESFDANGDINRQYFPDVRFSQKKSSLARYLRLDFPCWVTERVSQLSIAKVMVGPGENQASSKISAVLLLEQMGYPNVPVEMSKSTLVER